MSTTTFRYTDVVQDYRKVFKKVNEGYYYPVTFHKNKKDYKIIRVSIFDESVDDTNNLLNVTSRDFNSNTAFYLNFVKYTFSGIVVTTHEKPKWVIEPMSDSIDYILHQLNISSRKELGDILMEGHLITLVGGNTAEFEREIQLLNKKTKEKDSEINRLKDKCMTLGRQYKDIRDKYRKVCNPSLG